MTHRKGRVLAVLAVLGWVASLVVPVVARGWVTIQVLILANMVILSAAITCTVLAVIVRALPPVAAAWFLGYREALKPQKDGDGRKLRSVGG